MRLRLKYWLPAILIGLLISVFSTQYFSSDRMAHYIIPILHRLFPSASHHVLHLVHVGIRKAAHVVEFAVFSIAVFHGIRAHRSGWRLSWALVTLLIAVCYASLDELHQIFVPLRQPSFLDVLIDSAGALVAQAFVWAYAILHPNSCPKSGRVDAADQPAASI